MSKFEITPRLPRLLHGADYNPEQWLKVPGVFEKDIEYMKKAGFNCATVGVFSWSMLEPEDGVYDFDWLDKVINTLYENGIYTILATPTGARPVWMTHKYPEVSRVEKNLVRNLHGGRHNHCYTSPVFRRKTREMNTRLAKRYANNPAVIMWHISNEISGQCFCPLCQAAFREWLKKKYGDLEALNDAWYTTFWSQRYTDWEQIEPPVDHGMTVDHGLNLDWNRFCTEQTVDFYREEIKPLKEVNPDIPCTINLMMFHTALDYSKFMPYLDVVSWDAYPMWHNHTDDFGNAIATAFNHDWMRSYMDKPFMMMENTPSTTNWHGASKLKAPGMLKLSSIQALAHGSNTVQYFQWRQSNGSCEKFHSAVVSHRGKDDTMIFKNVAEVGEILKKLNNDIYYTTVNAKVAIIYDIENKWAIEDSKGPRNDGMYYNDIAMSHYRAFWENGVSCDVIDSTKDFTKYDILIAPMLYMLKGDAPKRLAEFVKSGKTLISSYFTGLVNETDLCYNGTLPAMGLDEVFGLWEEDMDALCDHQSNEIVIKEGVLSGRHRSQYICDLIHPTTAEVIGEYGKDWYRGWPALTKNRFGKGEAYYFATHPDYSLLKPFYESLIDKYGIKRALGAALPFGVTASIREGENGEIVFIENFLHESVKISLPAGKEYKDLLSGETVSSEIELEALGARVLK